jgi:hypothetical protein
VLDIDVQPAVRTAHAAVHEHGAPDERMDGQGDDHLSRRFDARSIVGGMSSASGERCVNACSTSTRPLTRCTS